jgi:pilus assembly protein Flp/PilA
MSALAIWMVATRQSFHTRGELGERGASLVEYALLVALIAVVCIAAVALLGANASTQFSNVGSAIQ